VPTPDHFIPLLYLAGVARAAQSSAEILIDGYAFGSVSMTSYIVDGPRPTSDADGGPSAGVPDPRVVPAESTNL
jgi:4,5-DOPA dioxygenase extradiol